MKKISTAVLIGLILSAPLLTIAAEMKGEMKLVPCGGAAGDKYTDSKGTKVPADHECGFNDLVIIANNIIDFLIYKIVVPLIAVAFMAIGANLVLNQNKETARSEAKNQIENMARGIFWILASFLLIKFILSEFLSKGFTLFLLG